MSPARHSSTQPSPEPGPREVYLDANAGMPLRPEARSALLAALELSPGNPSSAHAAGRRARRVLSEAREAVAALVGASPHDVVFTSGATESNLLALRGALAAAPAQCVVVTSRTEHASVARLCDRLEEEGVEVLRVAPAADGRIDADAFARTVPEGRPAVLSLVFADPVTGALQPVARAAALLARRDAAFHTDASQAAGRVPLDVPSLGVDLLTLSAQKIGGPPGVGALVVRRGAAWRPPHGRGTQEEGRRPGTEAVALVASFGAAARAAAEDRDDFAARTARLLAPLADLVRAWPGAEVLTPRDGALPNTLLVAFEGCPGDALVAALDARGVRVSTGTACASLASVPAETLVAAGRAPADAARAVRVSASWDTSAMDVAALAEALREVVPRVRAALATS